MMFGPCCRNASSTHLCPESGSAQDRSVQHAASQNAAAKPAIQRPAMK